MLMDDEAQRLVMEALAGLGLRDPDGVLAAYLKGFQREMLLSDMDDGYDAGDGEDEFYEEEDPQGGLNADGSRRTVRRRIPRDMRLLRAQMQHMQLPTDGTVSPHDKPVYFQGHMYADHLGQHRQSVRPSELQPVMFGDAGQATDSRDDPTRSPRSRNAAARQQPTYMTKGAGMMRLEQLRQANVPIEEEVYEPPIVIGAEEAELQGSGRALRVLDMSASGHASPSQSRSRSPNTLGGVARDASVRADSVSIQRLSLQAGHGHQSMQAFPDFVPQPLIRARRVSQVGAMSHAIAVQCYMRAGTSAARVEQRPQLLLHVAGQAPRRHSRHAHGRAEDGAKCLQDWQGGRHQPHRRAEPLCQGCSAICAATPDSAQTEMDSKQAAAVPSRPPSSSGKLRERKACPVS